MSLGTVARTLSRAADGGVGLTVMDTLIGRRTTSALSRQGLNLIDAGAMANRAIAGWQRACSRIWPGSLLRDLSSRARLQLLPGSGCLTRRDGEWDSAQPRFSPPFPHLRGGV